MDEKVKALFDKAFKDSPLFFIEIGRIKAEITDCVLPQQFFEEIAVSAQPMLSKLVNDLIDGFYRTKDVQRFTKRVDELTKERVKGTALYRNARKLGLDVLPSSVLLDRILSSSEILFAPDVYFYVCSAENVKKVRKKLDRIKKLEINVIEKSERGIYTNESLKDRIKINELEGELLGYPECCVSEFTRSKEEMTRARLSKKEEKDKLYLETRVVLECLNEGMFDVALDCFLHPEKIAGMELNDSFYSHFTSSFYPCSIHCRGAVEIGKKYEEYLEEPFRTAYKCRLVLNVLFHLVSGFESYRIIKTKNLDISTDYRKHVVDFFDSLDGETVRLLDRLNEAMFHSPINLGNMFILKSIEHI